MVRVFVWTAWSRAIVTLPAPETTEIQTSSRAAEALKPIAGPFAFAIFVMGVVGMNKLHKSARQAGVSVGQIR